MTKGQQQSGSAPRRATADETTSDSFLPQRVVVVFSDDEDARGAATWAKSFAIHLGIPLVALCADAECSADAVGFDDVIPTTGDHRVVLVDIARSTDIVVVAARHHDGATRSMIGAEPHTLARELPCPLLLIPPGSDWSDTSPILVGLDGTDSNRRVAEWSVAVASALHLTAEGVAAIDPMYDTFDIAGDDGDTARAQRVEADAAGLEMHEEYGSAEVVLRDIAHSRGALLTVVSATDHHSLHGGSLGTIVDHLIHTPPGAIAIINTRTIAHQASMPESLCSPHAAELAARFRRVVVPTDASDHALARARSAALKMAQQFGFDVMLYDRSHESWTTTPYPHKPLRIDQVDGKERPHLVAQMQEFSDAGIGVTAFYSTIPALTEIVDALTDHDVDAIICPDRLEHPKTADRLQSNHAHAAALVQHILSLEVESPPVVLVVPESGPVAVQSR